EAFLGTIEPGNDGPAVFSLQTEREGDYPYALTIRYSDDYGTHTARQPLRMVVAEADTIPTFAIVVVVVIVAVAVAIFWYRRQEREE
ncbi:MAG: S-layer protein, partial [Methanoculleus sp.]